MFKNLNNKRFDKTHTEYPLAQASGDEHCRPLETLGAHKRV